MLIIYRILSVILFPLVAIWLFFRCRSGKENPHRIQERLGFASIPRPQGDITWVHAVSVGEMNSALILVEELLKTSKNSIIFTTTTQTSAKILAQKLPQYQGRVAHQFLPVDCYFAARNFINFWQPKTAIFVESEIWPNLISYAKSFGAKLFLVNARMSTKSASRWRFARLFGVKIFDNFDAIFAQSKQDQKNLKKLTKNQVLHYGNLKTAIPRLKYDENSLLELKNQIKNRPIFLAISTHKGEEAKIINADQKIRQKFPNLLTIIVPRHPNRRVEIGFLLKHYNFAQRSKQQEITAATQFYLADTLGEVALFYQIANFAFIGGSFSKNGGHNPFEAIKLDCAVITGANTFNFKEIYQDLVLKSACSVVKNELDLAKITISFLKDPQKAARQNERALNSLQQDRCVERVVAKMQ